MGLRMARISGSVTLSTQRRMISEKRLSEYKRKRENREEFQVDQPFQTQPSQDLDKGVKHARMIQSAY